MTDSSAACLPHAPTERQLNFYYATKLNLIVPNDHLSLETIVLWPMEQFFKTFFYCIKLLSAGNEVTTFLLFWLRQEKTFFALNMYELASLRLLAFATVLQSRFGKDFLLHFNSKGNCLLLIFDSIPGFLTYLGISVIQLLLKPAPSRTEWKRESLLKRLNHTR